MVYTIILGKGGDQLRPTESEAEAVVYLQVLGKCNLGNEPFDSVWQSI